MDFCLAVVQFIDVSCLLYGSDVFSAYELAHGFTKPFVGYPIGLPNDVLEAQRVLEAIGKLAFTLQSNYPTVTYFHDGDLVEL